MAKHLTNSELVILGLLAEKPCYGYQLEQIIRDRGYSQWAQLSYSSLYYVLDKLAAKDYVTQTKDASTEGPTRKIFTITDTGLDMCRATTKRNITAAEAYAPGFMLGLANSSLLEPGVLEQELSTRLTHTSEQLQSVITAKEAQTPLPDFVEALFDYNISLLQAEREWLQKTVAHYNNMDKVDFKKELKTLYYPPKEFTMVDVPPMQYLMADGHGNPNTVPEYKEVVEALYGVAYTLKFASKKELGKDYSVMPLEGLWFAKNMDDFLTRNKDNWDWTMMIMQPDWITQEMFEAAVAAVRAKKNPPALNRVRLETYDEGKSVQIMHVGSYDDETPTLNKLHNEYMPQHGLAFNGNHHEIYLGDPRKADPSKLKTVLRQPVK